MYVVDVSAALSWLLEDERDAQASRMLHAVVALGAVVPNLWPLELHNALLSAERRKRLTSADVTAMLADVAALPISIERQEEPLRDESVLTLARRYGLTAYDAAYLHLSARTGFAIMTRDNALRAAASDLNLLWQ